MRVVALRLSEETARCLFDLLYMHGEHLAAGEPLVGLTLDAAERLGPVYRSIWAQIAPGSKDLGPAPSRDAIL